MEIIQHIFDTNGERIYQTPSSLEIPRVDVTACEKIPYKIFDAYFVVKKAQEEMIVPFNRKQAQENKQVLSLRLGTTNWFNLQSVDSIVDFLSQTEAMGDLNSLKDREVNLYVSGGISMVAIGIPN